MKLADWARQEGIDYKTAHRLVVVDSVELGDDLVRDMTEVLTSLCARLYGRRAAKNRAARAIKEATACK